ncbi:MAG TPA: GTPase domain-containing protein [Saprospiraceae bacterium]|nr:GTPase domain-containing protein [Saprospiraceae bacterium]
MITNKLYVWINIFVFVGSIGWVATDHNSFEPWIFMLSTLATLVFQIFSYRRYEILQESSNKKISWQEFEKKFQYLKKISVLGLGNVGKTTLIENICRLENQNIQTQGKVAYITKLSASKSKFVAILDASGQSQSLQNDIGLESEVIIILIDHNDSDLINRIDRDRLRSHEIFISLFIDRLHTKEFKPKTIFLLLNKQDLWGGRNNKDELLHFFNQMTVKIKNSFPSSEIIGLHFSNSVTSDCSRLIILLSEKI